METVTNTKFFSFLSKKIEEFNFSILAQNSTKSMGLDTLYDLLVGRKKENKKYRQNFSRKSREEINSFIQNDRNLKIFDYCEN